VTRPVLFTGDIFRQQPRGGITRYVLETSARLDRPAEIVLGLHVSEEAATARVPCRAALRVPALRGVRHAAAWANAWLDAHAFAARPGAIVHPSYYREPRTLPREAPVVATVFDMTHERFPGLGGPRDPARHKAALCRRAQRVVCISESTRRDVVERLGLPEEKTRVALLAGRDWSAIEPVAIEGADAPFVLWVGERHAYKNFPRSLEAWARCPDAAHTHLLCAGGAPFGAAESRAIAALGVGGRVSRRACTAGELRWAYEHALALVYTSLWEGFGIPVVEAFGLGCAVLASDIAPLREVGADEALYAAPEDADAIGDGLRRAIAAPRDPAAVARRRARAAAFSWDECARRHEAVYRELD